jgi:hypothetical protein
MPPSDLQKYFAVRHVSFSEQVERTAKPAAFLASLMAAIETLSERERERIFEDFERIDQLSDDVGQRALRSFIEHDEELLRRLHACHGEARGLLVLLADEEAFDHSFTRGMLSGCVTVAAGANIGFRLLSLRAETPPILLCSKQTWVTYSIDSAARAGN